MHCLHTVLFQRLRENSVILFGNKSDITATGFLRYTNRFYFKEDLLAGGHLITPGPASTSDYRNLAL
jgi:hypothetical protein